MKDVNNNIIMAILSLTKNEIVRIEKHIKYNSVLIRAQPIMETLTGIMIEGFIFF